LARNSINLRGNKILPSRSSVNSHVQAMILAKKKKKTIVICVPILGATEKG
jgi:hypothetical protein